MEDLSWPYWKFGFQRHELGKLHDQYNTFPSSILDPVAFNHDLFEISQSANDTQEFHTLLAARKQQRLRELNESLESASFQIIGNPDLIGTEQWQHALQLFRTKSLDSLVRYFASYLPRDHPWRHPDCGTSSSFQADSVDGSIMPDSLFDEPEEFDEPSSIPTSIQSHLPPSPSMTMCSDESSDAAYHKYPPHNLTPSRTLSFSGSESERSALHESRSNLHDDDASQPCDPGSPITSVSDASEAASYEFLSKEEVEAPDVGAGIDPESVAEASQSPEETHGSDTPTPRPQLRAAPFFDDAKPSLPHRPRRPHRSVSPACHHSLSQIHTTLSQPHELRRPQRAQRHRKTDWYQSVQERRSRERRSRPDEPAAGVRKLFSDPIRSRHRGRRRVDS